MRRLGPLLAVLTAAIPAQTIHVVASPSQLQPALDAARDGDVVELHCDVPAQTQNYWIRDASITLRSEPGRVRWIDTSIGTLGTPREIVLERVAFGAGGGAGLAATERVLLDSVTVVSVESGSRSRLWCGLAALAPLVVIRDSTIHGSSAPPTWNATVYHGDRSLTGGTALTLSADVALIENSTVRGGGGSDLIVDCAAVGAFTGPSWMLETAAGGGGCSISAGPGVILASDSTIEPGRAGVVVGPTACRDARGRWVAFSGGSWYPTPPHHAFGARAVTAAAVPGTFRAEGAGWALLGFDLGATPTPFGTLATTPLWAERAPFALAVPPVPALRHALVTLQAVEGTRLGAPSATWLR